ncbi:MAG: peptidase C45 [Mesorhizobium sp.]|uniref:C45 family autoproteolytic acyltransferase/hydolase n=1 Tax=Mesorhizobium sp. TaxID=1871066 RepID=UPI001AC464C4|nr:C45 family peptidase [Mesorhizobium sp.]MBN9221957.1 peptidase C45 [Mesorhizobium sp.]
MSTHENDRLATIEVSGTHYEVGLQLGRFAADLVHSYTVPSKVWGQVMTYRDDSRVEVMRRIVRERFPAYWEEMRGMAEGLGLPFDDIVLWHFRGDVWEMPPEGCTTVQIPGNEPVVAHNEDGSAAQLSRCAMARVRPAGSKAFTSFIYPGTIPGHAFAVSEAGLVATINHIGALVSGVGLPRTLLGRALLDCDTLDDAVQLLQSSPRSGAYHVTLAQAGDDRIFGVEFTHLNCSVRKIDTPQCHSNHLIHPATAGEQQEITDSSLARLKRASELVDGAAKVDPLEVLWDKSDPDLPVHSAETLATAVFHVGPKSVDWSVYDRVGEASCFSSRKN